MMEEIQNLVIAIAKVGLKGDSDPPVGKVKAFSHFFDNGVLDTTKLAERDGGSTRRELILRMLLLGAVLDQGPEIEGVRDMMVRIVNELYENEIRIFHRPLDLFRELNITVSQIWEQHERVKCERAEQWAMANDSSANKYNLFMDDSKQALNYAVFRWGVPLALPYLLSKEKNNLTTPLVDYLESYASAELMSRELKKHEKFGLGKAIGDKACHLFAKWMVSTFKLTRRSNDKSWGEYSYELPFDSNVGRVLWRTGYMKNLISEDSYKSKGVIHAKGKDNKHYIRVTNARKMNVESDIPSEIRTVYDEICVEHMKVNKRTPQKVEIQRFQHALLLQNNDKNLNVRAFDDGLIEIGTKYCFNHENPKCSECPINKYCKGYQSEPSLIREYRT